MTDFTGCIAIDWGTSSFRAYLISADGEIAELRQAPVGILKISDDAYAATFTEQIGDWLETHPDKTIIMSGMIGSRQGWLEAPYAPCPANLASLSASLTPLELPSGRQVWFAAGLSYHSGGGTPDVMRGEETQILGAVDLINDPNALICLPGTHSKWVSLDSGSVAKFETHMTGEVFETVSRHTILSALMDGGNSDDDAFTRGLDRSSEDGGLLNHLFGVRALGLFDQLSSDGASSYLSGLLIGHEIRAASGHNLKDEVHLIGDGYLVDRYQTALSHLGIEPIKLPDDLAARGLTKLAKVIAARESRS